MKARTIVSLSIIGLAVLIYILDVIGVFGESSGGFASLLIGIPLFLIGLFLLVSYVSPILILVGIIVHLFVSTHYLTVCSNIAGAPCSQNLLIYSGLVIILIGIIYGIVEGIIKLVKHYRK